MADVLTMALRGTVAIAAVACLSVGVPQTAGAQGPPNCGPFKYLQKVCSGHATYNSYDRRWICRDGRRGFGIGHWSYRCHWRR